jgi:hypothetical protein
MTENRYAPKKEIHMRQVNIGLKAEGTASWVAKDLKPGDVLVVTDVEIIEDGPARGVVLLAVDLG